MLAPARRAVAGALKHPEELAHHPADDDDDGDGDERVPVCVAFAEQFVVDVSAVDDSQLAALGAAMGDATFRSWLRST
ncbi:MAG: hypothetical protein U0W40_17125 [Acidimicrobiia bacterium]